MTRCYYHHYFYWEKISGEISQGYRPQPHLETRLFPVRHWHVSSRVQTFLLLLVLIILIPSSGKCYSESKPSSEYYLVAKDLLLSFSLLTLQHLLQNSWCPQQFFFVIIQSLHKSSYSQVTLWLSFALRPKLLLQKDMTTDFLAIHKFLISHFA